MPDPGIHTLQAITARRLWNGVNADAITLNTDFKSRVNTDNNRNIGGLRMFYNIVQVFLYRQVYITPEFSTYDYLRNIVGLLYFTRHAIFLQVFYGIGTCIGKKIF